MQLYQSSRPSAALDQAAFQPTDDLDWQGLIADGYDNKNIGINRFVYGGRSHVKSSQHAKAPCLVDDAHVTKTSLQRDERFL